MNTLNLWRTLRRGTLTSLLVGATTCAPTSSVQPEPRCSFPVVPAVHDATVLATPPAPQRRDRFVYLITIDGVRWQDALACDHNPNLCRLADLGVTLGRTGNFHASGPNCVSLPGYLEITRGHPSDGDCRDNYCKPSHVVPSIIDDFATVVAISGWTPINLTLPEGTPGVRGTPGDPWGYRPDPDTWRDAQTWLASPAAKTGATRFMWLSLGDTDEYAHSGAKGAYLQALERADFYVASLYLHHSTRFPGVDADFIVTADHGRSQRDWRHHGGDPTSCRLWLFAFGTHVPRLGSLGTDATLSGIRSTVRHLAFGESGGLF